MTAYSKFKALGIYTPMDLSRWAKERGLLGVHIVYVNNMIEYVWEVRKYDTLKHIASFPVLSGKSQAEEQAKDWASVRYDVDCWCRIEGMGNTLFPLVVGELVKDQVGVSFRKRRQHSKG
jgi:hypothetical protein